MTLNKRPLATATATPPAGERAFYELGHSGIPVYNVNNNCSTGSTALFMAKQFIEGDIADCVMALGFREDGKGITRYQVHRSHHGALDKHMKVDGRHAEAVVQLPRPHAQMFGNAGIEHMEKYGTKPEHFAKIGWKNHKHSVNNPYSQFQDEYSLEDILAAPHGFRPADQAAVLPDLRRIGGRDCCKRRASSRSTASRRQGRGDPGHGDDHGFSRARTKAA